LKKGIEGVIFDLDGVIVTTDEYHYRAWKKIAMDEEIYFDRKINERLRGVSRMQSLEIILERTDSKYTEEEKVRLAERKNNYYKEYINQLNSRDILPGALPLMEQLKMEKIRIAVGSSSKNCDTILERIGLSSYFDAVVSGNDISRSKPDPEVFLLAAQRLCLEPGSCLVVEDALAGVTAALQAGMKVLAVGSASSDRRATIRAADLSKVTAEEILAA